MLGLDKSRSVWFWLKEYYLRIRHLSVFTNPTAYNEKADQLLNECLDFADVHEIREFVVSLHHPDGSVYVFWTDPSGGMVVSTCAQVQKSIEI